MIVFLVAGEGWEERRRGWRVVGKLAGGTEEEFARKLAFSVGRHLMFWTLGRRPDPAKSICRSFDTYFALQKPGSVFGRGTLLRDGPKGLCQTSSATPSEQRRELMLDLAWLSSNPNQVSPAVFVLVFQEPFGVTVI